MWFFFENWHKFSILVIKNNDSIKIKASFQFEVLFFLKDENNGIFKLWFLKTFWKLLRHPLIQFSKFNSFLWVYWFLYKILFNFVPPSPCLKTLQTVLPYPAASEKLFRWQAGISRRTHWCSAILLEASWFFHFFHLSNPI